MTEITFPQDEGEPLTVDLKHPGMAAFLAWLIPGAGHFYQGRKGKAVLFFLCIMGTFLFGLGLGRGRVVYASAQPGDYRWQYICQAQCGLVAMPAVAQWLQTADGKDPFFVLCERYPGNYYDESLQFKKITPENRDPQYSGPTLKDGFMAPPPGPVSLGNNPDVMSMWYFDYRHDYDMGLLFTVVAGLLNVLAIYDAAVGPAIITPLQKQLAEQ